MGAWSPQPFGNDDACDWVYGLEGQADLTFIELTLQQALAAEDALEAPEANAAIAAVEVLAKLRGKGTQHDGYTDPVDDWVATVNLQPNTELLALAAQVLQRVTSADSELNELWQNSDEYDAWLNSIRALQAAITS